MRGISFSSSTRLDPKHYPPTSTASSTTSAHSIPPTATPASRIMKKLSTTFRRKTSVSPPIPPSTSPPSPPSPSKHKPSSSPLSSSQLQPVQSSQKKPSMQSPRAMTFSVPSRHPPASTVRTTEIPFFGDRRPDSRSHAPKFAVVRGVPAPKPPSHSRRPASPLSTDPLSSETASDGRLSLPSSTPFTSSPSLRNQCPPVLRDANRPLDTDPHQPLLKPRRRHLSFDPNSHLEDATNRKSDSAFSGRRHDVGRGLAHTAQSTLQQDDTSSLSNNSGRREYRRWLIPSSEARDKPRLFTPGQATTFGRITRHRDRAEARTLVSACTFLEAEIVRLNGHVQTHTGRTLNGKVSSRTSSCACFCAPGSGTGFGQSGTVHEGSTPSPVCIGEGVREGFTCQHCSADCAKVCPLVSYLPEAIERLDAVLRMLEERYDTIEEVYVKSEEYTRAMGRFFNLSTDQFSKLMHNKHQDSDRRGHEGECHGRRGSDADRGKSFR